MQSQAIHGKVHDGNVEPGSKLDSTLLDLLDQIEGAEVLVTVTVLREPCLGCIHKVEEYDASLTTATR